MVSSEPLLLPVSLEGEFSSSMKEMIGGCCVCSDERGWAENPLVYCDGHGCNVAVHQGERAGEGSAPAPASSFSPSFSLLPVFSLWACFLLPPTLRPFFPPFFPPPPSSFFLPMKPVSLFLRPRAFWFDLLCHLSFPSVCLFPHMRLSMSVFSRTMAVRKEEHPFPIFSLFPLLLRVFCVYASQSASAPC